MHLARGGLGPVTEQHTGQEQGLENRPSLRRALRKWQAQRDESNGQTQTVMMALVPAGACAVSRYILRPIEFVRDVGGQIMRPPIRTE
jgi:hypothetical protein